MTAPQQKPCTNPNCNGGYFNLPLADGEGWKDKMCPECKGTGFIPVEGEKNLAASPSNSGIRTHELKTDPEVFDQVRSGRKTFEIRKNDRDFLHGDRLILRRTKFTGAEMRLGAPLIYNESLSCVVCHVMYGPIYGLQDGWCIMSIYDVRDVAPLASEEREGMPNATAENTSGMHEPPEVQPSGQASSSAGKTLGQLAYEDYYSRPGTIQKQFSALPWAGIGRFTQQVWNRTAQVVANAVNTPLQAQLAEKDKEIERLTQPWRVMATSSTTESPFIQTDLKIIDVGHADRILMVELPHEITQLRSLLDEAENALNQIANLDKWVLGPSQTGFRARDVARMALTRIAANRDSEKKGEG
jgi:hypothetical protein